MVMISECCFSYTTWLPYFYYFLI